MKSQPGADRLSANQKRRKSLRRNSEEILHFTFAETSLGFVLLAESEKGICAIQLGPDPEIMLSALKSRFPSSQNIQDDEALRLAMTKVVAFVENPRLGLDLPLDVQGTAFQKEVWRALDEIQVGTTASYAEIAQRIGKPRAVRAVARACAANSLALAIPCHRVIRTDGGLSGYRWGLERKQLLLTREKVA